MGTIKRRGLILVIFAVGFALLLAALLARQPWTLGGIALAIVLAHRMARWAVNSLGLRSITELLALQPWISRLSLISCLVLFPILLTVVFKETYWIYVATIAGIYVCLALGLNIVVGLAGLLDLGYIAFYAIGAYVSALISLRFPQWWALWLMIPACMAAASVFGVLLGAPTLKLKGDYLAIVTLGFGEIIRVVLNNWNSVTNGPIGLPNIPYPRIGSLNFGNGFEIGSIHFTHETLFFALVTILGFTIAAVAHRLDDSRIGRAWRAIREDELAASAMGINTRNMKLLAFATGASFAGVSGVVFAHLSTFIEPNSFVFMESAFVLCMVVLGGMGSIPGVMVGAILLTVLPEKFRDLQDYRMLVLGLCLIFVMRIRPQGLIPRSLTQAPPALPQSSG